MLAARFRRIDAGGVFVMKEDDRGVTVRRPE
jgi:hypothetical protein